MFRPSALPHYKGIPMDIYEVEIAICPNCQGAMRESCDLPDGMYDQLFSGLGDFGDLCVVCPDCKIFLTEEFPEYRTEYHRQVVTTDDGDGELIELQWSESPDMTGAASAWYRWTDEGPVSEESFAGIDATFESIMAG